MLITETQTVKQFSDESEFKSNLSFSLEKSDVEDWVVVENDAQELSLSLVNWKKLVELANKVINQYEKKQNMENNILKNNTIINKEVNPLIFTEEAKDMENQKDAKYNEMLETLEIVAKKLNGNGFPSLQNQIEKVIKDVKFKNK